MIVVADAYDNSDLPRGGVAAIGNFDGVHCGQQAILREVVSRAEALGVPSIVVTFDPHPLSVVRPDSAPLPLCTPQQKERLLEAAGVSVLLSVQFTRDFARTPARTFVRDFLVRELGVREVYVGKGFTFGHQRDGNLALLQEMGGSLGFHAEGVEEINWRGERVSSTRIRRAIQEGRIEEAAEMLGYPYSIQGSVVRGDRMGQKLGWPTMNLAPQNRLLPADGVYAGRVFLPSFPASFHCVTNIGTRPTVYENYERVVESHILDFKSDVYGQQAELSFLKRLREERIFPSVMELSAQIRRDVEATREYFTRRRVEQDTQSAEL
jgi:riboflavin kinase/FMN adenylyltransferase